jgi:hypothetical protein
MVWLSVSQRLKVIIFPTGQSLSLAVTATSTRDPQISAVSPETRISARKDFSSLNKFDEIVAFAEIEKL